MTVNLLAFAIAFLLILGTIGRDVTPSLVAIYTLWGLNATIATLIAIVVFGAVTISAWLATIFLSVWMMIERTIFGGSDDGR